jgi:hypothetical protein
MNKYIAAIIGLLLTISFLAGCTSPTPTAVPPTATSAPTETSIPTAPAEAVVTLSLPEPASTDTPSAPVPTNSVTLPGSLYLFLPQGDEKVADRLWRLDDGATAPVLVTPEDQLVSTFDVLPGDGRIAYATRSGQLYWMMPGEEPRLLVDAAVTTSPVPMEITSVAWSPDGRRLAYTLRYAAAQAVETSIPVTLAGLWVIELEGRGPQQILSVPYAPKPDPKALQAYISPVWSPDGKGMLISAVYFEWSDWMVLDPVAPGSTFNSLWKPEGSWGSAIWSEDGKSLFFSGATMASTSDLVQVQRDTHKAEMVLDGKNLNMYMHAFSQSFNTLFMMAGSSTDVTWQPYRVNLTDGGVLYSPLFSPNAACLMNEGWAYTLYPGSMLAFFRCSGGASLVSFDTVTNQDLLPYLGPFAQETWYEAKWGPGR